MHTHATIRTTLYSVKAIPVCRSTTLKNPGNPLGKKDDGLVIKKSARIRGRLYAVIGGKDRAFLKMCKHTSPASYEGGNTHGDALPAVPGTVGLAEMCSHCAPQRADGERGHMVATGVWIWPKKSITQCIEACRTRKIRSTSIEGTFFVHREEEIGRASCRERV